MNYELDTYLDALTDFPKQDIVLRTEKGEAVFVKMDIFKGLLWYTYKENRIKWYKLTLAQVNEIISLNKSGEKVAALEEYEFDLIEESKVDFENVVGQDSLTRFDTPKRKKKRRSKNQQRTSKNQQNKGTNKRRPHRSAKYNKKA